MFAEWGVWIWPKKNRHVTFERYRLLYRLARSYNLFAEKALTQVVNSYDAHVLGQMIQHCSAVLVFDLTRFYANPALVDRQELHYA